MRRLIVGIVVAAAAALVPAWATAGNQQVAEQIATALRDSGQLHGYRIGVKYQDGTAWLKGQVATRDEMGTAMQLALSVPGVTRVVNQLTVRSEQGTDSPSQQAAEGAVSIDQKAASPNLTERLTTKFIAGPDSPVETAGLLQPALQSPSELQKVKPVPKPILAPVRPTGDTRVQRTGLEEPTLAPPRAEVAVSAATAAPQPMPTAYAQAPLPMARANGGAMAQAPMAIPTGAAPARYDQPNLPNYAWPSYSAYPNYASLTYPKQYSPTAWPYIGPFYPYPQVPLGWRKVTLEWHDGWWALDFDDGTAKGPFSGLFRPARRKY